MVTKSNTQLTQGVAGVGDLKITKNKNEEGVMKVMAIRVAASGILSTAEQLTGFTLPAGAVVHNSYLDVLTAEATGTGKTVEWGISGVDDDGFGDAVSVSSTGRKILSLANGAETRGALLKVAGSGGNVPIDYVGGGGVVTWKMSHNNWVEFVGDIIIVYSENPSAY